MRLKITIERLAELREVEALVQAHRQADHWLQRTSGIEYSWGGLQREVAPANGFVGGPLLAGEFFIPPANSATGSGESLHLRCERSLWVVTRMWDEDVSESMADEIWDRRFISTEQGLRLCYRCYWRSGPTVANEPVSPSQPHAARFMGFDRQSQEA